MRRLLERLAGAAAAGCLVGAGLVAAAAPAEASACSGTSGVTVVVDTGSSLSTRCASGDPDSAMAALQKVADVRTPDMFSGTVVCRIDGYPSSDPCHRMPPADAYWAFFHAPAGGSWTYSSSGVSSYDPPAGSVVGFRFGSGQQPRTSPPGGAAKPTATPKPTTPKPTRTTAPTPTSTPRTTTSRPRSTTTSTTPRAGSASGPTPTRPSGSSATPTPSASASTGPSASPTSSESAAGLPTGSAGPSDGPDTTAAAAPSGEASGGGTATLLAGSGLVLLVAGGAGWTVWRRRTG